MGSTGEDHDGRHNEETSNTGDETVIVTFVPITDERKTMKTSTSTDSLTSFGSSISNGSRKRPSPSEDDVVSKVSPMTTTSDLGAMKQQQQQVSFTTSTTSTSFASEGTDRTSSEVTESSESSSGGTTMSEENDPDKIILPKPDEVGAISPDDYLAMLLKGYGFDNVSVRPAKELSDFFGPPYSTPPEYYTTEIVGYVRNHDLAGLQKINPHPASSNRYGESLLHMACRRGFEDIVTWFLKSMSIPRICDDGGRTPLHDAMWNPTPQLNICGMLVKGDPSLLLITDVRGFTPFQYARPQHWSIWRKFLYEMDLSGLVKDEQVRKEFGRKNEENETTQ